MPCKRRVEPCGLACYSRRLDQRHTRSWMESAVTIAAARAAHIPLVQRLAHEIWHRHYPGILSAAQIDYMLERGYAHECAAARSSASADAGLALAHVDDEPAGFAAWYRPELPTMKLDKLYVLPPAPRRRHRARADRARRANKRGRRVPRVTLNVNRQNASAIARVRAVRIRDPRSRRLSDRRRLRHGRLHHGARSVSDAGRPGVTRAGEAAAALRQLHAQPARVRAAVAGWRRRPLHVRPDGLRLPAHRQLPDVPVRGHAEARAALERLSRPPRDEHHRRRPPDVRRRHRRRQDGEGRAPHGQAAWEIAALYTQAFQDDIAALNIEPPDVLPRATDHIPEQIAFIADLERRGYTYRTADGIYFDTSRQADYGYLARLDKAGLEAGKRVDVGEKRNVDRLRAVEVLAAGRARGRWNGTARGARASRAGTSSARRWRRSTSATTSTSIAAARTTSPSITRTRSRRPKRASARGSRISGCTATSCCRTTRRWRSRPASSCASAALVERGYDPLAFRYLCLTGHYRTQLNFTWEALDAAATGLARMRTGFHALRGRRRRDGRPGRCSRSSPTYVNDDLNTPRALALAWDVLRGDLPAAVKRATLARFDEVFGLGLIAWQPPQEARAAGSRRAGASASRRAQGEELGRGRSPARRTARGRLGDGRQARRLYASSGDSGASALNTSARSRRNRAPARSAGRSASRRAARD